MTSAESVDGSAMMTSAVMSSQSEVSYSATSQWYLKLAIAKRCPLVKWIRQRFDFALRFSRWILRCDPVASTSRPTTGVPAASISSPAGQPVASTSGPPDDVPVSSYSESEVARRN
ncbi:ribonuclease [Dorcoceras hygrometricum]|uniref:Ribonuclease n=1 Tax=Dorcoceras hygrometricum TaxID=472368 RepID=A0A2Z7BWX5_9LAMI|nr:ribonuclease [Dorcoceras hygrometricum]